MIQFNFICLEGVLKYIFIKASLVLLILFLFTGIQILGVIAGSAHDFSSDAWNSSGEICLPCHIPHNADMTVSDAPLWNHEVTTATYTLYSSPTMNVPVNQPQGVSVLCLSCHDGTVALDSYGGTSGTNYISGNSLIGTNLSDDHPISIEWQHQTNDLHTSGWCSNCHNMHSTPTFVSELPFFNRYIECATCHDVHNTSGYTKLLRKPLAGSEICFHCHNK